MTRSSLWGPIPDGARAGRRVEGGTRHMNAEHGEEGEFVFEDRDRATGAVLAGFGFVGLILDGEMEGVGPIRAEHVLKPDVARDIAYALLTFADISERKQR